MTKLTPRQQLDNIEAALVEDILALSDEELLAELKESGEDPEEYARMATEIIAQETGATPKPFDITDAHNRYEPCPVCRRDFGMGLRTTVGQRVAWCSNCGHEGPGFPAESEDADELAFDGWNEDSRDRAEILRQD